VTAQCARWLCLLALALPCLEPAAAQAGLELEPGSVTLEVVDATGSPETRAGAHPDRLLQAFRLEDTGGASEDIRDIVVEFPPGLSGDLNAVPFCPRVAINRVFGFCPSPSQVGRLLAPGGSFVTLHSVQPGPSEAVAFAAPAAGTPIMFAGRLRSGDQGLVLHLKNLERSNLGNLMDLAIELWGIPADRQEGTSIPRRALLTLPTRCDAAPLSVTLKVRTWQQPDRWMSESGDTGHALADCESLNFEPRFGFALDDSRADAPSGARIDVVVPQNDDPDGRATSLVNDVSIEMPAGVTVSPGGTAGIEACGDTQFGLNGDGEPACPAASRVGSVEMDSVSQTEPTAGAIYLGQERPGERFRLLIAASAPGAVVKFAGSMRADPKTGRLTTALHDLPQAAFDRMTLRFEGGPRALLATPLTCGPAPASARLIPNSGGPPVERIEAVGVAAPGGGACAGPQPFAPSFTGGSTDARAGRPTSFTTTVRRQDGEQLPARLAIALPPGLSAGLGTIVLCSGAQAQAGSCPAGSRVGTAVAELGPGDDPARMEGDVYLTEPYRRAPFGVAFVLDGAIGPFDLGTLVVRGALRIDPLSGQVRIEMDALPTIFEGVPIRFQAIGLDLDRPGFMHNPTSCAPSRARASLRSTAGATATPSTRFGLRGCIDLPFRPGFSVALGGGEEQLRGDGKPALRMSMRMPAGGANLRSIEVRLPRLLQLDPSGPRALCPRRRALAGGCPPNSRIGTATARTPLLGQPMDGFLYLVQPKGDGSPDLWAALSGQGLKVNLRGTAASVDGRTETRFAALPDFPLESLRLRLSGGGNGMLKLSEAPCGRLVAPTELGGQNGARRTLRARVAVPSTCRRDG
jgi:hypothetical protein